MDTRDEVKDHAVVLFDGVCNLCTWSVQFIVKRDPAGKFRFASLQSDLGKELVSSSERPTDILSQSCSAGDCTRSLGFMADFLRFPHYSISGTGPLL